jgi:hypothetical protein
MFVDDGYTLYSAPLWNTDHGPETNEHAPRHVTDPPGCVTTPRHAQHPYHGVDMLSFFPWYVFFSYSLY